MIQKRRSPIRVPDEVEFFNLPSPSSRTMALGSIQPLTEISTRNLPGGKKRPASRADNLTAICEPNVRASTCRKPKGLHGLYRDHFIFIMYNGAAEDAASRDRTEIRHINIQTLQ
jgi:hypothetical protein